MTPIEDLLREAGWRQSRWTKMWMLPQSYRAVTLGAKAMRVFPDFRKEAHTEIPTSDLPAVRAALAAGAE